MSLDHRLIELLVCPVCKGPLELLRDTQLQPRELVCPADRLAFPIRDGLPVMLETDARALDAPAPVAPTPGDAAAV
ncbi:Trm112 family protein [uncultured Azohydromonas sp.]|jgi:Uncharacterized conserved protein|uniref:Trm112 family protein n=1 Tax=uncultured Azohydromonas sp. TaxID=487342 RepID=UPI0026331661|nr:Trm112 family protein [uncultured Azohydromonas sp.]